MDYLLHFKNDRPGGRGYNCISGRLNNLALKLPEDWSRVINLGLAVKKEEGIISHVSVKSSGVGNVTRLSHGKSVLYR